MLGNSLEKQYWGADSAIVICTNQTGKEATTAFPRPSAECGEIRANEKSYSRSWGLWALSDHHTLHTYAALSYLHRLFSNHSSLQKQIGGWAPIIMNGFSSFLLAKNPKESSSWLHRMLDWARLFTKTAWTFQSDPTWFE